MRRLGFPVKETDQGCSLVQLKRHGSLTQHRLRLGQELARELGAMGWSGTAHGWHPVALTIWVSIRQSPVYQTRQGNLIVICETDHLASMEPRLHNGRLCAAIPAPTTCRSCRLHRPGLTTQQTRENGARYSPLPDGERGEARLPTPAALLTITA